MSKGYRVASNRAEWVTYNNIERMYELVYAQMVKVGVVDPLAPEDYYYINEEGETVDDEDESVGMQIKMKVTHLDWILVGDEVGTDTSQKNDGHVGGQKFVIAKDTRANVKSRHNDGRFTLIGLTAANEELVIAVIIMAAEELTFE